MRWISRCVVCLCHCNGSGQDFAPAPALLLSNGLFGTSRLCRSVTAVELRGHLAKEPVFLPGAKPSWDSVIVVIIIAY